MEKFGSNVQYRRLYLLILDILPPVNSDTLEDMDFIFGEVMVGLMEWSYYEKDEKGIKIATYAHFALNKKYNGGFSSKEFRNSRVSSKLYTFY